MPNKKRKITTIEDVDEPEERELLTPEDEQSIEALEQFSNGFGPKEIRYRIHKMELKGPVFKWTDTIAPDDWEQWIQSTGWGAGEYRISAVAPNQMSRSFRVLVGDPLPGTSGVNPSLASSGGSWLERELLRRMDAMEARLTQPMQATPVRDIIEGVKAVQEMSSGQSRLAEAIELAKLLLEAGKGGGDTGWLDVVKDVGKEVVKPLAPMLAGILAPKQPIPNNEGVPVQQVNLDDAMRQGIQWLKKQALAGVDPTALLHIVEANASEYEPFIRFALDKEFNDFASIDPEINSPTYVGFFKALHDGLRSDFKSANPVDANTSGTRGDAANATSNGATGKRRK